MQQQEYSRQAIPHLHFLHSAHRLAAKWIWTTLNSSQSEAGSPLNLFEDSQDSDLCRTPQFGKFPDGGRTTVLLGKMNNARRPLCDL
jgi:hypothetical protein